MSLFDLNSTIVAIATPIGVGGISIVRLSGSSACKIADTLFLSKTNKRPSEFRKRDLVFGDYTSESVKDECLCVVFDANSFTGEETVEFHAHGGIKITEHIVEDCIKRGARLAKNGEFSLRAYINGKMSVCEAEGMIDMINAESDAELKAGHTIMKGGLTKKVEDLQAKVTDLLSEVEVSFDYPEEDIEYIAQNAIDEKVDGLIEDIEILANTYNAGAIIKNGINACLIGKPNVGKSSLLNALLNREKAIVTNIAGTTRDVIEDAFEVNGIKVNILDTAGIRQTNNIIERMGVDKSIALISQADIVLFIVDSSAPLDSQDAQILKFLQGKKYLTVYNKCDKIKPADRKKDGIYTSTKTGEGIDNLKATIYNSIIGQNVVSGGLVITNSRHKDCLLRAKQALETAKANLKSHTLDLIAIDLNEAFYCLGEITGNTSNETILDAIFSKFCLGK